MQYLSSGQLSPKQRLIFMIVSGLVLSLFLSWSGVIKTLEQTTYDLRFQLRGPRPVEAPIVLIVINDESFNVLNQNLRTWPRAEYAHLIDMIAAGNPAVIGVDVAWVHDETGTDGDATLANSLETANPVILAGLLERQEGVGYSYERYASPIRVLENAAAGVGLTNVALDNDGVVRRISLHYEHNNVLHQAFGCSIVAHYQTLPTLCDNGQESDLLINYHGGPNSFPIVSMYQVLNEEISPARFTDQIVLIGFTTFLEQDLHVTPFDQHGLTPGIEIHANVVSTLLQENAIQPIPLWLAGLLEITAVSLTIFTFWKQKPGQATTIITIGIILYLIASYLLFVQANVWLPVVAPVGLVLLTASGGLIERVLIEEQEKRRVRERFQSFMAPERLTAVLDRWEELVAENRPEVTATVLFSDIRGFTAATEELTRQGRSDEVIRFLNQYADQMVEAIFATGGVLDKIMGDGLLVLFGAPEQMPDHALQAIRAAFKMNEALPALNNIWPLREERPLRIGIGIHTGLIMDGIVGRGRRVEYTIIGDTVNTASRVQDYTKEVLTRHLEQRGDDGHCCSTVLITEATYQQIKEYVRVDPNTPSFQAKGKSEPLRVYEVLGLLS